LVFTFDLQKRDLKWNNFYFTYIFSTAAASIIAGTLTALESEADQYIQTFEGVQRRVVQRSEDLCEQDCCS